MLIQNDPFRDFENLFGASRHTTTPRASMPMDAYRRGDNVWVHIDMPGVSSETLDINVERSVLTVTAERTWNSEESDKPYLSERYQGTLGRQVHLGEGLDAEGIEADLHDGVLTLRIPVAEKAKPRKIQVNTGTAEEAAAIDVESAAV
jgi:HSP20 family protein